MADAFAHIDILDQRESLRGPFTGALTLHLAVIVGALAVVIHGCLGIAKPLGIRMREGAAVRNSGGEVDSSAA